MIDLVLCFFYAGTELAALLTPPCDVVEFLIALASLNIEVVADATVRLGDYKKLVVYQFPATGLANAMLLIATLLHVTPFPIFALIVRLLVIAHPCSRVQGGCKELGQQAKGVVHWFDETGSLLYHRAR